MIFLDSKSVSVGLIKKVYKLLVVEFKVRNGYFDLMLIPGVDFLVKRGKDSWYEASVFVVILCTGHGESLSSSSLSVAHDGTRVSLKSTGEYLFRAKVVDDFLRGVIKNFLELESPLILLMVDNACLNRSFDMNANVAD
jgi:hypothetical protein